MQLAGTIFLVILAIALLCAPSTLYASGLRIFDQSASATGQASAFTAQADDASAVYYNPAGMTQLRGIQSKLVTYRRADGKETACGNTHESVTGECSQFVISRCQRGGQAEGAGARRGGVSSALRAADIDPRQICGIWRARGIEADPVTRCR